MLIVRAIRLLVITLVIQSPALLVAQKPFDTHANSEQDLEAAKTLAKLEQKQILLDFGANWCGPCLYLDRSMRDDADIRSLLANFVVVRASLGGLFKRDKHTAAVRARYPPFGGIPTIMVLDADGTVLRQADGIALTGDAKHDILSKLLITAFLQGIPPAGAVGDECPVTHTDVKGAQKRICWRTDNR